MVELPLLGESVLVVAAHPDDEVLGCGGTVARLTSHGIKVNVIIAAEGLTSRKENASHPNKLSKLQELRDSAVLANNILGVNKLIFLNLPDNRLDSLERLDLIKTLEEHVERLRPSVVLTHHSGDVNVDHRRLHEAVITACRPIPNHCVKLILAFEVSSSTEWQPCQSAPFFQPNLYIDISNYLDCKLKALECYSKEMRDWPHSRSIQAQVIKTKYRGSQVGVEAAETFSVLRALY
jgi:LmbE family N-acetylglucosaminyl deacetylase